MGSNHAVVLKGYDDEQGIVYLSDSINGNVTRSARFSLALGNGWIAKR